MLGYRVIQQNAGADCLYTEGDGAYTILPSVINLLSLLGITISPKKKVVSYEGNSNLNGLSLHSTSSVLRQIRFTLDSEKISWNDVDVTFGKSTSETPPPPPPPH